MSKRTSRSRTRGFVTVPDLLGAALVGAALAYVGAQSMITSDAIAVRAASESAGRRLSSRAAATRCDHLELDAPDADPRFIPHASAELGAAAANVDEILATLSSLDTRRGAPALVRALELPRLALRIDVATETAQHHRGNVLGTPGGPIVGRAWKSIPCRPQDLPRLDDLSLARTFFAKRPFGAP